MKNWRVLWEASTDSPSVLPLFPRQGQDSLAWQLVGSHPLSCPSAFLSTRLRKSYGIAGRCLNLNPGNDNFILRPFVGFAGKPWHSLGSVGGSGPLNKRVAGVEVDFVQRSLISFRGAPSGQHSKIGGQQLLFQEPPDPLSCQCLGRHSFRPPRAGWGALRDFGCSGAEERYCGWVFLGGGLGTRCQPEL